jgi:ribosomal protein S18 acetylase RimI-like enzyme
VNAPAPSGVRLAGHADMAAVGQLLHDFNREFGDAAPAPAWLAQRLLELVDGGETDVLVAGSPPHGVAVVRYRRSLFTPGLESYLAELYVVPDRRGRGIGRALLETVLDRARARGADYIELNTDEGDDAAMALYESAGFHSGHGSPGRPRSYYYEREL